MQLFERVYYSIKGKKIKSLLLLLVIALLGTFLSASFSIYQANKSLESNVKRNLIPGVIIHWEKDNSTYKEIENIINSIKKDERLVYIENRYDFSRSLENIVTIQFEFKDKNLNPINDGGQYKNNTSVCYEDNCIFIDYFGWKDIHAFDSYILSDLKYKELRLIYGRNFSEDEKKAIIPLELTELDAEGNELAKTLNNVFLPTASMVSQYVTSTSMLKAYGTKHMGSSSTTYAWWTSTLDETTTKVNVISNKGAKATSGLNYSSGVRPAIWVDFVE